MAAFLAACAGLAACVVLLWQVGLAKAANRELLLRLSAEQGAHKAARDALTDAGLELARLREKLVAAEKRAPSVECAEMLRDLQASGALLHVSRINPDDVFLMSPRTTR